MPQIIEPTTAESQKAEISLNPDYNMLTSRFSSLRFSEQDSESEVEAPSCTVEILNKLIRLLPIKLKTACSCPYVLIADDERFQHFCYKILFEKSFKHDNSTPAKREELHINLFFDGETLLRKFNRIASCGCNGLILVIVDYSMGSGRLNGIETALRLRKAKYTGPIILRTSETEEYLQTRHHDYHSLIKGKVINEKVSKDNIKHIKDVIRRYVHKQERDEYPSISYS